MEYAAYYVLFKCVLLALSFVLFLLTSKQNVRN